VGSTCNTNRACLKHPRFQSQSVIKQIAHTMGAGGGCRRLNRQTGAPDSHRVSCPRAACRRLKRQTVGALSSTCTPYQTVRLSLLLSVMPSNRRFSGASRTVQLPQPNNSAGFAATQSARRLPPPKPSNNSAGSENRTPRQLSNIPCT
jgi:hypothetical protein